MPDQKTVEQHLLIANRTLQYTAKSEKRLYLDRRYRDHDFLRIGRGENAEHGRILKKGNLHTILDYLDAFIEGIDQSHS